MIYQRLLLLICFPGETPSSTPGAAAGGLARGRRLARDTGSSFLLRGLAGSWFPVRVTE